MAEKFYSKIYKVQLNTEADNQTKLMLHCISQFFCQPFCVCGVRGTPRRLQAMKPPTRLAVRAFRREVIARISPPFLYLTLLVASLKSRWYTEAIGMVRAHP
jgi:hypothetical protein